ncbi:MAG: transglutaminase family protein, partial [Thiohalobacterales bacterium]|nr:transglutaminase family protein [Thiohalobacterales bacterium]
LGSHTVRLVPRSDGRQRLLDFSCKVSPEPALQSCVLDATGNPVVRLWFAGTTTELGITTRSLTETLSPNAFDFIVDAPATRLPVTYSAHEQTHLGAYSDPGKPSAAVIDLAVRLARKSRGNTLDFLNALNSHLFAEFETEIREHGPPQDPARTLVRRRGACRDLTVLFISLCRTRGIAARFVSGYQAHAQPGRKRRYLHAWPEVYIPGGGWRGFDPSHGTAVADAHVALAAAETAAATMPIEGTFYGDVTESRMDFELSIETDD